MGFGGFLKDGLQLGFDSVSGGATRFLGEDTLAGIPVLNSITGAQSDSEKALLAQQKKTAEEAEKRARQNAQERMNTLGQSMLAFNPQNQMMAQMFGPQAAFTPQQFAQMGADPGAKSQADFDKARQDSIMGGAIDPKTRSRIPAPMQNFNAQDLERMRADQRRQAMLAANMQPIGPGPAALAPRAAPAAARKF